MSSFTLSWLSYHFHDLTLSSLFAISNLRALVVSTPSYPHSAIIFTVTNLARLPLNYIRYLRVFFFEGSMTVSAARSGPLSDLIRLERVIVLLDIVYQAAWLHSV